MYSISVMVQYYYELQFYLGVAGYIQARIYMLSIKNID